MQIDAALLQFHNKPLVAPTGRHPSGAAQVAGTGARVADASHVDKKSKLFEQCQEFESIFVKMMLKEMRNSVDKTDSLLSGGWAEDIYSDMLDDEYSRSMAKNAGFGLADQLYKQLARA
ncbi:MAG: rod-binding protein [Rectinemataceae bacterium]|jgi:flagellar protein FlgJ